MALVRPVSKLRDKNGLECDIAAEGFGGTRNVQISGDVVGNETWDGSGNVDIRVEIADNAVDNSCLTDGAVSTSKILDGAVTSEKLDTGAVTNNKLASGAVSTDKIANGAVTLAKISESAVDATPTASSNNLVTSGGVKAAIEAATGGGSVVNDVKYEGGKLKQTKGQTTTDVVNLDGVFAKNADVVKKTDVENEYSSTSENPISGKGVENALKINESSSTLFYGLKFRAMNSRSYYDNNVLQITEGYGGVDPKIILCGFRFGPESNDSPLSGRSWSEMIFSSGNNRLLVQIDVYWKELSGDYEGWKEFIVKPNRDSIRCKLNYFFQFAGVELLSSVPSIEGYSKWDASNSSENVSVSNKESAGSPSTPVFVNEKRHVIPCTVAELMAGKDALGNSISSTYATKSEVNNKTAIKYADFSSKEDLNNAISPKGVTTYYRQPWETPSALNRPPSLNFYTIYIETKGIDTDRYIQTAMCPQVVGLYCVRHKTSNGWTPWTNVRYSPRNSNDVASFSSDDVQAYTGKAIAEYVNNAIGGNVGGYLGELTNAQVTAKRDWKPSDWFVAREKGTNVSYTTTSAHTISYEAGDEIYLQSNNELSVKPTTVYEKTNNKVTTVDDSNMHYPTTGAVKSFVENQISNLSVTYYNKTETDNAITEQIGTLDAEVTGVSTNVDVKVNQSNGKVTGLIVTDRTQTKFDTVNSSIENLQSSITTGLSGKQDTLQWMTNDEVDTLWQEA